MLIWLVSKTYLSIHCLNQLLSRLSHKSTEGFNRPTSMASTVNLIWVCLSWELPYPQLSTFALNFQLIIELSPSQGHLSSSFSSHECIEPLLSPHTILHTPLMQFASKSSPVKLLIRRMYQALGSLPGHLSYFAYVVYYSSTTILWCSLSYNLSTVSSHPSLISRDLEPSDNHDFSHAKLSRHIYSPSPCTLKNHTSNHKQSLI